MSAVLALEGAVLSLEGAEGAIEAVALGEEEAAVILLTVRVLDLPSLLGLPVEVDGVASWTPIRDAVAACTAAEGLPGRFVWNAGESY